MADYLFTYGTLRLNQSHPIANFLADTTNLVGLAELPNAKLYHIDWYPALIKTTNKNDIVIGDVVQLKTEKAWPIIDEYEGIGVGNPPYEYRREKVIVRIENKEIQCWVYFYNIPLPQNATEITSGDFLNP